ncbi:MAG: transcription repressor NadR [Oscillospiraceae bacterium]
MDADMRRKEISQILSAADAPVSAASLGERFGVSRQVIVGDVALLRACGLDISATPRGYLIPREAGGLIRAVACIHGREDTEKELLIIVDNGCSVMDVVVEHPVYGQLTGELSLSNRYDVRQFIERLNAENAAPLSALTGGIHLHHLRCPDESAYARTLAALADAGLLLGD